MGILKNNDMTTITTQQLIERLSQSFTDIKPLTQIETSIIDTAKYCGVNYQFQMMGETFQVGTFSNDNIENDDTIVIRYVYGFHSKQTFTF